MFADRISKGSLIKIKITTAEEEKKSLVDEMVEINREEMSYQRRKRSIRHAKVDYRTNAKEGTVPSM